MREGSYSQIKRGMRVLGRNGETLGGVDDVIADEASGIFVGLAVRPPEIAAHALKLRGELVDRVHDDVVHTSATAADLEPYRTPAERYHEAEEAYETLEPGKRR